MSKKIIFFGNERLATGVVTKNSVLNALIENGYEIETIILNQEIFISRKEKINETELFAVKHNIRISKPKSSIETEEIIKNSKAKIAVLVAYGKLIPQSIIDLFPLGIINLHPSLLPDKRGSTPIEQTILDGDKYAGVSIMQLTKGMDSGPIYKQKKIPIEGSESKQELATLLNRVGADLIVDVLPKIISNTLKPIEQSDLGVTFTKTIHKSDGRIDWNQDAEVIDRMVRAYSLWPKTSATIFDKPVSLIEIKVGDKTLKSPGAIIDDDQRLRFATKNREIEIISLVPENKSQMSGKSFINGYKK
ncbi:MAG: methionyl-tRNA formyltransferase [Candidatus Saccharibacteria bacterium]